MPKEKKSVLIVLDGWGYREASQDNAIAQALTPFYDQAWQTYPKTLLQASESYVGLPQGVMGNSEVGHTNIGCGRKVIQDQVRIYDAIASGALQENQALLAALDTAVVRGKNVHLMGLVSTGNVHSAQEHYCALLDIIAQYKFPMQRCFFHAFLDGRDTPPQSAGGFVDVLEDKLTQVGARMATISGRYYAMDRDQRWERTELAYRAMVMSEGDKVGNARELLQKSYAEGLTDEFIKPAVVVEGGQPVATIAPGDVVLCFNFRADRMRQIVRALAGLPHEMSTALDLEPVIVTMTEYDRTFGMPVMFPSIDLSMSLGEYLAVKQKKQFRIAETEKYAHVTFFFNGGRELPFVGETRYLVPSPKVATYDITPAMHSKQVTEKLVAEMASDQHDFLVVNYAQPDMVGHTGNWEASIAAVEATDQALSAVCQQAFDQGYTVFLTADHGNIEMMKDPKTREIHTSHTLSPVPLIMMGADLKGGSLASGGSLSNIAPTIITSMGLAVPPEMTATNLLQAL